ncbi:MAG: hypothetical protein H7Y37_17035 [Anaerolineae bacterium]|nr:hypothetical protein [Gloeobacterales cyanobacterium ES-bin-313]
MLTIEFEPSLLSKNSECCAGITGSLTRMVYWEGHAYAAYYVLFTSMCVSTLISTGDWSEDALSAGRVSFFMQIWSNAYNYQVELGNAKDSPWGEVAIMGRTLDRHEAMTHPSISDVFHIVDRMLSEDLPIIEHLIKNQLD